MTQKQITDYVFVGQEQVSTLFKDTDSKRAENLMRLFGVEKATKLFKLIGDYANAIEIPAEPEGMELYAQQGEKPKHRCGPPRKSWDNTLTCLLTWKRLRSLSGNRSAIWNAAST